MTIPFVGAFGAADALAWPGSFKFAQPTADRNRCAGYTANSGAAVQGISEKVQQDSGAAPMVRASWPKFRLAFLKGVLIVAMLLSGCAAAQKVYNERYELKNLTVVFLDEKSLQESYTALSGKAAVMISGSPSAISLTTVRGFFDFKTNTIYCSKMDFQVCGHELHHAVFGRFHPDPH